jgi:hypothetical protein
MGVQPVVVGGTYDWFLNPASINTEAAPGVFGAWNITGATVTITFINPFGTGQSFTATVTSGPAGQAHYVNATSLFNVAGQWGYSWRVSLAGTVLESDIYPLMVKASGAATA